MKVFIGTSGWEYDDWRGNFYPESLAKGKWLEYYGEKFNTVEVNSTFYRLPTAEAVTGWHDESPTEFKISLKASRYITHMKKLLEPSKPVKKFLRLAGRLEDKIGILLFQLPPNLGRDGKRLENFVKILDRGYRYSVEFRDKSWFQKEVYDILHRYDIALCIMDMPGLSSPMISTTDFTYVRFHGSTSLYRSSYSKQELKRWAGDISKLDGISRAYIYFNNDARGHAVENAMTMQELLQP
jgi:uncharacterized protein YecE (DUF72 family)